MGSINQKRDFVASFVAELRNDSKSFTIIIAYKFLNITSYIFKLNIIKRVEVSNKVDQKTIPFGIRGYPLERAARSSSSIFVATSLFVGKH